MIDKKEMKKLIKSFTTNVGLGVATGILTLTYAPIVIAGEGFWALLVCDVICVCGDTFFAIKDWKKIKTALEESE